MANAELDMKANLTDLTKIPPKEFEKHFRDWMDRDDVARALQAKLRTDLISNFNKTALGRQILAQTSTTTQRLILSPLVLALNTLVAEFLYAQNCHFSLSVFCAEVPYRNILPDFENTEHFRFTAAEIKEILEAVFGKSSFEAASEKSLIKKYECSKNVSLLLLLIRHLMKETEECMKNVAALRLGFVTSGTQTSEGMLPSKRSKETRKTEIPRGNIKYLNKYLITLSNKVKEMSAEFEELRNIRSKMPSTKISKSVRTRRYDKLNRGLERIVDQLKHITHTKRKSKQAGAVVAAIDSLATQFFKCFESFKLFSKKVISSKRKHNHLKMEPLNTQAAVQVDLSYRSPAVEEKKTAKEKTYIDWVHEMRHTKNGQKFLDRIEASLKKALNKQRELLRHESEEQLHHQKELLKIQYKEKLIEHITQLPGHASAGETCKFNESMGHPLEEFECRHNELLQKIQDVHDIASDPLQKVNVEAEFVSDENVQTEMTEAIVQRVVKEIEPKLTSMNTQYAAYAQEIPNFDTRTDNTMLKNIENTQKQIKKMTESIAKQERNVDQIVYEARLRIQELENESNQLELNFRNYLERQRIQAETMREVTSSLSDNKEKERPTFTTYLQTTLKNTQKSTVLKAKNYQRKKKFKTHIKTTKPNKELIIDQTNQENKSPNIEEYPNAILNAKLKLFQDKSMRRHITAPKTMISDDDGEVDLSDIETFHYNRNFGKFESRINLSEKPTSVVVHPPTSTFASICTMPFSSNMQQILVEKPTRTNQVQYLSSNKQKKEISEPRKKLHMQPFSDPTTRRVIAQKRKTRLSTLTDDASDNNECDEYSDVLTKDTDSEISISSDEDGIHENQSMSDLSKSSTSSVSSKLGSFNDFTISGTGMQESASQNTKKGDGCVENVYATAKTTLNLNPKENSMTLMKTIERMHRLFTEIPTGVARGKWTQTQVEIQEKPKQHQEIQPNRLVISNSKKPSTPTKYLDSLRSEYGTLKTLNKLEQPEPSVSILHKTEAAANISMAVPESKIKNANLAAAIDKSPTTISSTTLCVNYDDNNLKESVSESSLEIATMVEANDEEIELDDVEEEEEHEVEVEEEEVMGGINQQAIIEIPVIEKVSSASSTTNSILPMSAYGGGGRADIASQSDSGSDFWK